MRRHWLRVGVSLAVTGAATIAGLSAIGAATGHVQAAVADAQQAAATISFTIGLAPVVTTGLSRPVHLTHAGDGSGRLFVVEQAGRIRIIENGVLLSTPFLTITSRVRTVGSEEGLLSVAFPPDYDSSDVFYVYYTNLSSNNVVARYSVTTNPNAANPNSEQIVLTLLHPGQQNHNGGQLAFGPDGYLYVGPGDGGGGGDQNNNGQSLNTLLGKILRLDVSGATTYTIPASNPFTQTVGARPEIWAYGLRNPWRFSFDRATGDLYIADVGQGAWEEVDYQPGASTGGENYGWRIMEGLHCFNPSSGCDMTGLTLPVVEHGHAVPGEDNCSITGGFVYRGNDYPWMSGVYFYADYCSGRIWTLEQVSPGVWSSIEQKNESYFISSFGEDESGELYVLGHDNGDVYKITSTASPDLSGSYKSASNGAPATNEVVTYSVVVRNTGGAFATTTRLTDTLPAELIYVPGSLTATLGAPNDAAAPTLRWSGVMSSTAVVTISYAVNVTATGTQAISNSVTINPGFGALLVRSATVIANGQAIYLPLILKND